MLLLDQNFFDVGLTLHLERKHCWEGVNPGCLRDLVALTILIVLVIWDLITEYVFPGLIKIVFILNVEDNIRHHINLSLPLRHTLFVLKLDKILDLHIKEILKGTCYFLNIFF